MAGGPVGAATAGSEIDRRLLLAAIGGLLGAAWAGEGWALANELPAAGPRFFSEDHYRLLEAAAETMIPRTDTGGARDAGVAARRDAMMSAWASPETQGQFTRTLDEIDAAARAGQSKKFVDLAPAGQLTILDGFDRVRAADPAFIRFKRLIFALYNMSELGATQELRYEPVPGTWQATVKVTANTRTWAWEFAATGN